MKRSIPILAAVTLVASLPAQDLEKRVEALERENQLLRGRVDALDQDVEAVQLGKVVPQIGESRYGLGPAASKIYSIEQGVSIGGYGEYHFQQRSGNTDRFDALRSVLYFGYKFNEQWIFNSEIEIEHGTTSTSSGTTSSGGSVSLEFGQIDYLHQEELNARAGLMLVPMGLINELHEPTTFLASNRPETERRIIPSTWRALGAGVHGTVGGFDYRAYVINSLDGEEFEASGLRGGRQKGNRAAADDFAGVVRVDWVDTPGLLVGGSVFYGMAGQDGLKGMNPIPSLDTLIVEGHVDFQSGPLEVRALAAVATVDGAAAFNTSTGENLGKRLQGYYVEAGFDVLAQWAPETGHSLTPFVRWEHIDTQADMPAGFAPDPKQDDEILTFGVNWKPIDQVVIKVDYFDRDQGDDQFNILLGYVF